MLDSMVSIVAPPKNAETYVQEDDVFSHNLCGFPTVRHHFAGVM